MDRSRLVKGRRLRNRRRLRQLRDWLRETIAGRLAALFLEFAAVLLAGAAYMYLDPGENPSLEGRQRLSFIDALYFAVVTTTSVGWTPPSPPFRRRYHHLCRGDAPLTRLHPSSVLESVSGWRLQVSPPVVAWVG